MATSANVIEYRILDKSRNQIGHHRQHLLCTNRSEELLRFEPLEDHIIQPFGYDEEDEYWEGDEQNLRDFLIKSSVMNRAVKEYFANEKRH